MHVKPIEPRNAQRKVRIAATSLALPLLAGLAAADASAAELTLPPISIGAGMRTSFTHESYDGESASDFNLDSARLYINGSVTDQIKFTFNTEYNSSSDALIVMDAVAQFSLSDQVNIWAGRFLPPSDRSNLYGPYYANNWYVYTDQTQDWYPNVAVGRDNGLAWWGQFGALKLSAGVFDVPDTTGDVSGTDHGDVLYAARAMYDFWDVENGYYLNGTYYGDKDLLAIGAAYQKEGSFNYYSADFLLEKKLSAGAFGVEAEYAKQNHGLSYYTTTPSHDGWYALAHYVFPGQVGIGKFQILGKYGSGGYQGSDDVKTSELDLNYIIKAFNARASLFYARQEQGDSPSYTVAGLGLQIQM
ncbi:MAG: hypothetical protein QM718_02080 [Steroidobacteraceae bacterium]